MEKIGLQKFAVHYTLVRVLPPPPFLAGDAFVKTNRHDIAMVTVFVRLSVRLGRACTVIIRCPVVVKM